MNNRRKQLILAGIDDLNAHRLEYFLPGVLSIFVVCAPFVLVGYAFDHERPFRDSCGAGVGLLVGLATWLGLLLWFVASGGGHRIRERRRERRRQDRIEALRHR
jgi:hypothetical protein